MLNLQILVYYFYPKKMCCQDLQEKDLKKGGEAGGQNVSLV